MFATGAFEDIISAWYFTTPVAQSTINIRSFFSRSLSLIITHISNEVIEYNTQYLWYGSNSYDFSLPYQVTPISFNCVPFGQIKNKIGDTLKINFRRTRTGRWAGQDAHFFQLKG